MLNYFRSKKQNYMSGFSDGYDAHKQMADKKIRILKKKIKEQRKRIRDIEKALKVVSDIFNDAREYAVQLDKMNNIKLSLIAQEYQQDKNIVNNIMQFDRQFNKYLPEVIEKIERSKIN